MSPGKYSLGKVYTGKKSLQKTGSGVGITSGEIAFWKKCLQGKFSLGEKSAPKIGTDKNIFWKKTTLNIKIPTKIYPEWDKYLCRKYAWENYIHQENGHDYTYPLWRTGNSCLFHVYYGPCIPLIASCLFAHLILMKVLCCCCLVAKSLPTLLQPHGL